MENKRSMGVNFIFNVIKTLMGVLFPLITFPYVSRVLGPSGLGKIDYVQANMTYFTLIAGFGVSGYAVREGARLRDDREKMNRFAGEVLAVNLVTVAVAYACFFLALLLPKLAPYRKLMLLFSVTILLTAMGVEWVFNIYEEYRYITVRAFFFQLLSLVLLFVLVKSESDYVIYACILILSSVGSNVMNLIRSRRYVSLRPRFNKNFAVHFKPMMLIFFMTIASSIYMVMDRSMLGYITGDDAEVGLYGAAIKITVIITSLVNSVRVVMTPRVAYTMQRDEEEGRRLNHVAVRAVVLLSTPCAIGLFFLSSRVLALFCGAQFGASALTLRILLIDVIFAAVNGVMINQIFITARKDKWATMAVCLGALSNLVLNAFTIPIYGKEGAAVSTVIAELVIFIFAAIRGRELYKVERMLPQLLQSVLACAPMVLIFLLLKVLNAGTLLSVLLTIGLGAPLYFVVLFLFKNELVRKGAYLVIQKLQARKNPDSLSS